MSAILTELEADHIEELLLDLIDLADGAWETIAHTKEPVAKQAVREKVQKIVTQTTELQRALE